MSWSRADIYPLSLPSLGPANGSLRAHRRRLEENAPNLFYSQSRVPLIEFDNNGQRRVDIQTITGDADLQRWIASPGSVGATNVQVGSAVTTTNTPNSPAQAHSQAPTSPSQAPGNAQISVPPAATAATQAPQKSPIRCRFVFFTAPSGQSRLDITYQLACKVLTYFQVMPNYIDYLSVFKVNEDAETEVSDLRFSGFHERLLIAKPSRGLVVPQACLGGRNYQICYSLKSVANKSQGEKLSRDKWQWSPRQSAIHHQFDLEQGVSLWIVTGRSTLRDRIEEMTGAGGRSQDRNFSSTAASFISSLAVHLTLAQWASEDWQGYVRWLEEVLEEKTIEAMRDATFVPMLEDISFIQKREDETNKAIMMLHANADILKTVAAFYTDLMKKDDFDLGQNDAVKHAVAEFLLQLQDSVRDFEMQAKRAQTLGKITADRKNLVQQHLQGHSTAKMEFLAQQSQREAIVVRVIAVITLLYLPATFVSTLFSTDIVKYQNETMEEVYSSLALQRWWEVTAPLTLVTGMIASAWLFEDDFREWRTARQKRKSARRGRQRQKLGGGGVV
ncbi:hypothetical protein GQ53DRAFT_745072 [Thozetella sp. PMI_491]|nr:hypothetical protein GQ53DRAFT_745072 [Thozetella sp. PMI_491]